MITRLTPKFAFLSLMEALPNIEIGAYDRMDKKVFLNFIGPSGKNILLDVTYEDLEYKEVKEFLKAIGYENEIRFIVFN